ncbi:glycosyltransferase family 4 protein [Parerythrobacter aurantius]|uniref:glycosyltransferase family 4 protein n=1 Tax=Parerythrobacter aurantius TaxID=3127706 RepID=UPI003251AB74
MVLSSLAFSLINFRGKLLQAMRDAGHEVVAVAPDDDTAVRAKLSRMGITMRPVPMDRTGTSLFADLSTISAYVRLLRQEKPDVVLAYTQKPIIYGGLACRIAGVRRYYALMSGLGYLFSEAANDRPILRSLFCRLYRAGLKSVRKVFVFNSDDRQDMIQAGILDASSPILQVPGSGVDLERFRKAPLPTGTVRFLMIGRLMRDKGVWEYARAAAIVAAQHPEVEFSLIGRPESSNPTGLGAAELAGLKNDYPVTVIDETDDVPTFLRQCHVFVLPTYYREGLPRTILEALAVGRAVITTEAPGCRDAVTDGVNGFLVPPKNVEALAEAMLKLVRDREMLARMADRSRNLAETVYDVKLVNHVLLSEMQLLPDQPIDFPHKVARLGRKLERHAGLGGAA